MGYTHHTQHKYHAHRTSATKGHRTNKACSHADIRHLPAGTTVGAGVGDGLVGAEVVSVVGVGVDAGNGATCFRARFQVAVEQKSFVRVNEIRCARFCQLFVFCGFCGANDTSTSPLYVVTQPMHYSYSSIPPWKQTEHIVRAVT